MAGIVVIFALVTAVVILWLRRKRHAGGRDLGAPNFMYELDHGLNSSEPPASGRMEPFSIRTTAPQSNFYGFSANVPNIGVVTRFQPARRAPTSQGSNSEIYYQGSDSGPSQASYPMQNDVPESVSSGGGFDAYETPLQYQISNAGESSFRPLPPQPIVSSTLATTEDAYQTGRHVPTQSFSTVVTTESVCKIFLKHLTGVDIFHRTHYHQRV